MSKDRLKVQVERVYTIPLGKAYYVPRKKRGKKCLTLIKKFIRRHMKEEDIVLLNEVNEYIFSKSIEKPPRRIKVLARKVYDEETDRFFVEVSLYREPKPKSSK